MSNILAQLLIITKERTIIIVSFFFSCAIFLFVIFFCPIIAKDLSNIPLGLGWLALLGFSFLGTLLILLTLIGLKNSLTIFFVWLSQHYLSLKEILFICVILLLGYCSEREILEKINADEIQFRNTYKKLKHKNVVDSNCDYEWLSEEPKYWLTDKAKKMIDTFRFKYIYIYIAHRFFKSYIKSREN